MYIFGKAGVIGGGEGKLIAFGKGSRGKSKRTLGGDMQMVGSKAAKLRRYPSAGQYRKPDFRIGRAGYREKFLRRDHLNFMAKCFLYRKKAESRCSAYTRTLDKTFRAQ